MRIMIRQMAGMYSRLVAEAASAVRFIVHLLVFAVLIAVSSPAQDYLSQAGNPAFSVAQPVNFGFVNIANGNLHTEINLADAPQRGGLAFSAKLIYDSRIWQPVSVGGSLVWKPTNIPNSLGGWRFVTSADPGIVTFDFSTTSCGGLSVTNTFSNFVWQSPDGTKRTFPLTTIRDQGCGIDVSSADAFASDSSGYHMYVTNHQSATVYAKDGTKVFPTVQDTNGNHFSTDANGNVVDTLGRTVVTKTVNGNQIFFDVLNSQGTTSRITMTTRSILVQTVFSGSQTGITDDHENMTIVDSVALPNGDSYSFSYDESEPLPFGFFSGGYGLLKSISLSGGIGEEYTYTNFVDSFGVVNRWATSGGDSTIAYRVFSFPGCTSGGPTFCTQGVLLARNGGTVNYLFTMNGGAWNTDMQFDSGFGLQADVVTDYDFSQSCVGCLGAAYVRPTKIRETIAGSETDLGYDNPQFGNITSIHYSGTVAALGHQTIVEYSTDPALIAKNIINRVKTTTAQDGGGNQRSQTKFEYDTTSLAPLGEPVVNLDTTLDAHRGNLTHVSKWTGGTAFLDTYLAYDASGQVVQVKDSVGNITKFSYADNFFNDNGINPPPSTSPAQATHAYLSAATTPTNEVTQFGYYFGTGKQAFATDPNGQTTFEHFIDPLDRLTQIIAPKGWRALAYDSLVSAQTFTGTTDPQPSTSCTGCIHTSMAVDSRGHLANTTLFSDPDGPVSRAFSHDFAGNLLLATNPVRNVQPDVNTNSAAISYDVMYRPTQIVHPDRSVAKILYGSQVSAAGGNGTQLCPAATYGGGSPILTIDEAGKRQQQWRDVFGNMIEADEPDSNNGLTVSTCYQYNIGGELTQVVQGDLTRSYVYDPLWRVTQVTTPEAGTEVYNYLNDDGTLCSGDPTSVCKRTDARGIATRYHYDSSGRVVGKTYSDGTPTAVFNYGESSALGLSLSNTVGRLSSVYTLDAAGNKVTGEVFSYDVAGNIINNSQCTPQNCGTGVFQNSYASDLVGNITNFSNSWGRSISTTYDNAAQVTSVNVSPADPTHPAIILASAKYNEFGSLISASLGNGLKEVFGYTSSSDALSSIRVGSTTPFSQAEPGNEATPGKTTLTISGAVGQLSTTASAGGATLLISGAERTVANGTQSALQSSGSMVISGHERSNPIVQLPAAAGAGSVTVNGAVESKQVTLQAATAASANITVTGIQQSKTIIVQPPVSGTDVFTIQGSLQSKSVTTPSTSGTGSFTINGALQTKATVAATGATGAITLNGSEQSKSAIAAKSGSAILNILGTETSVTTNPCGGQGEGPTNGPGGGHLPSCPVTVWNRGTVSVTVNGFTVTKNYQQGSSGTSVASDLATGFNVAGSPVNAVATNASLTLTSQAAGAATNYPYTSSSTTSDTADFSPAFSMSTPSGALTNGADGSAPIFDSGTCSISINGTSYSSSFGQGDTTTSIAARLATVVTSGNLANATSSGPAISLNTKQTGSAANYALAAGCSFDSSHFTAGSFNTTPSGATLTGGVNAVPAFSDSGSLTLTIGPAFSASACYGASGSCTLMTGCPSGDSTGAQLACTLASPNNSNGLNRAGSPVTASVSAGSNVINIRSNTTGASTNYSLSSSSTFNSANFSSASFASTQSGVTLSGGTDALTNTAYDAGMATATVGGHSSSYNWSGPTTTAASIGAGLAAAINADAGALVSANIASPGTINLTARSAGSTTNYPAQTSVSFDSGNFAAASFNGTFTTSALTGGADAVNGTVYDAGTITVTINGHPDSASWGGQGATSSDIASALVTAINGDPASLVTASVPPEGTTILLSSQQAGASSNYPLSVASTFDNTDFSTPAFTAGSSLDVMVGGKNAVTKPIYDSGTLSLTVGNFTASAPYGPSNGVYPWEYTGTTVATLTTFLSSGLPRTERILSGHIHESASDATGIWHDTDLTAAAGVTTLAVNSAAAFAGSATTPEHLFYLNTENGVVHYHIHELSLDGTGAWHDRDVTSGANGTNAFFTTPLVAFAGNTSFPEHAFFLDGSGHIHELYLDSAGNWHDQDNTALAGAPAAYVNTQNNQTTNLAGSFWPSTSSPERIFYINSNPATPQIGHLHEIFSDSTGAWHDQDLTTLTNGPSALVIASIADCAPQPGDTTEHIMLLGETSSFSIALYHFWQDASGWHFENTGQPGSNQVTCFMDSNSGFLHAVTSDNLPSQDIHDNWKDDSGVWHSEDVTTMSNATPFSNGRLYSLFDGFAAHVFYNGGYLYSASPNPVLLATALVNDPRTGLNISSSPIHATLSGNTISLVAKTTGGNTNYPLFSTSTFDNTDFISPSYSVSSGISLAGGLDATIDAPTYDFGFFGVTINNHTNTINWGAGDTPQSVASNLVTAINLDPGAAVTATSFGSVVTFTSKATGANTNYAYIAQTSSESSDYGGLSSFAFQPNISPPPTLTGGRDANGLVWDNGTIAVTVNGFVKTVPYGQNDFASSLAKSISAAFNADPNSPVWACQCTLPSNPGLVTFQSRKDGSSTNYTISAGSATSNSNFTGTAFPVSLSNSTLLGGADSGGTQTTISDSGIITLTIGSFHTSLEYGQNANATPAPVCCGAAEIALALANQINQSSSAPVVAGASGAQLGLTAKAGGASTNYTFSTSFQSNDPGHFPTPSFAFSATSGSLAGGADKPNPSSGSSSMAVIAINGEGAFSPTTGPCTYLLLIDINSQLAGRTCIDTPFNAAATAAALAQSMGNSFAVTVSGTTIVVHSQSGGANTNYPILYGFTDNIGNDISSLLPTLPFNATVSGSTMTGGSDNGGFIYALDLGTDVAGTVFAGNDSVNGNWDYFYDNLNRLQEASTPALGYQYSYDRYGNRLQQTPLNGGNPLSAVYLNNRLVATGVVYDASGNMIQDGNHTYVYDAENRLVSVDNGATATYIYSVDGLRVRSSVSASVFDYIHDLDGETVGVLGPGGALIRQEIGGLATYSDAAYFHHRDWLGNLRAITDQTGAIRKTCTNLPFGDALTCTSPGITPTNFTGYARDTETNLDLANARYYTSQFGRFMSPDPLGGDATDPQSINSYSYVLNNALSAIDPSGMDPVNLPIACGPGTGHPCGGTGGGDGGGGDFGGPFGGGGIGGGGPGIGICLYPCVGFAGGGPPVPGPPSAAGLANESGMVSAPGFLESLIPVWGSGKAAIHDFQTGHYGWGLFNTALAISDVFLVKSAITAVGKIAIRGLAEVGARQAIGSTGKVGEAALEDLVGGISKKYFPTSRGARFVDQFAGTVAHESKTGYTSLTRFVRSQIAKDSELIASKQVSGVVWHFYTSPLTGVSGASRPLFRELIQNGISIAFH